MGRRSHTWLEEEKQICPAFQLLLLTVCLASELGTIFPGFTAGLTECWSQSKRSGLSFISGRMCVLARAATLVKSRTWDNPQRPLGNLASASLRLWQACGSDKGRAGKQNSVS